jgi:20S proteasome alpha/beta subunit
MMGNGKEIGSEGRKSKCGTDRCAHDRTTDADKCKRARETASEPCGLASGQIGWQQGREDQGVKPFARTPVGNSKKSGRKTLAKGLTPRARGCSIGADMTVGIAIKCADGLVVASDSLAIFGRGVPISKLVAKIHKIEDEGLEYPVIVLGAGATAFVDKFLDRVRRDAISQARKELGRKLDVIDFAERVCEVTVTALFKEYAIDRQAFLGLPSHNYSIGLIIAGVTKEGELRAFHVHADGLSENIPDYGTVGSGAAYAELFLREVVDESGSTSVKDAQHLAVYSVKGAELMDPNVGGRAHVMVMSVQKKASGDGASGIISKPKFELKIETVMDSDEVDELAKNKIRQILKDVGKQMRCIIKADTEPKHEQPSKTGNGAEETSRNREPLPQAR